MAEWLAGAAAGDPAVLEGAFRAAAGTIEESGLDVRTHALVRLAALVAVGEPGTKYDKHVAIALDHGVTPDEIVGVLVALAPTVGADRITAVAAPVLESLGRVTADVPASSRATRA
jgi:4-carboxymuconolactone decarboxylase